MPITVSGGRQVRSLPMRWLTILFSALVLTTAVPGAQNQPPDAAAAVPPSFEDWLVALRQEARERGFSDALLDETLADIQPLERVVQSDRSQAELNPGFARYLSTRLTPSMIGRGKEMSDEHHVVLGQVERKFNVQRRFLLALWGRGH